MSGQDNGFLAINNCKVTNSSIKGSEQSVSVGGIAGAIDMHSEALLVNCISDNNTISATHNAGGLLGGGGIYSFVSVNNCTNSSTVTAEYSGAGGLIGTCDSTLIAISHNIGNITGGSANENKATAIGAGGLIGGGNAITITSSDNSGQIIGYAGVGGLLGSTRIKGSDTEAYMYGNVMVRYSYNTGDINGIDCVGGIVGESQTGTYAVYNTGTITGTRYVAGIVGCTSIAVVHNAINTGNINGVDYVSGIIGKTSFGSVALNQNYGTATAFGSHLGGIIGLAGNNTIMHYCSNFGELDSQGEGPVGGLIGEVGDPRIWTAMNIADCVIGAAEIAMAFVGPAIATVDHFVETTNETLSVCLSIAGFYSDVFFLVIDFASFYNNFWIMLSNEDMSQISAEVKDLCINTDNKIKEDMTAIRRNFSPTCDVFDSSCLGVSYANNIESMVTNCDTDDNGKKFNDAINIVREERQKELEKMHQTSDIIHQVVSGICLVVGTVTTIAGVVATGGAAAVCVAAGAISSAAGGLNTITKTANEFEENVVVISQCLNNGKISASSGDCGGLVGRLQDASIVRDCLNIGKGSNIGTPIAGHYGNNVEIHRSISLALGWKEYCSKAMKSAVVYQSNADNKIYDGYALLDADHVGDPIYYTKQDKTWEIGINETSLWKFGSSADNKFPIPAYSEMIKTFDL